MQGLNEFQDCSVPHKVYANPHARRSQFYGPDQRHVINLSSQAFASETVTAFPGYEPTPLRDFQPLADDLHIDRIWYKDESERFGLNSFKSLGTAFAVYRVLADEVFHATGTDHICVRELMGGRFRNVVSNVTLACATDGNHGRSVAWAAQLFSCKCVVYIHESVSKRREDAIRSFGAEVVRTLGTYDDAMRHCARDVVEKGYVLLSDKATDKYWEVPRDIMQGYTVMLEEVMSQLPPGQRPSHVFVQSGVGALAGALCGHLWELLGRTRPRFVVVEPERADCLYQSAVNGAPTAATGKLDTIMAGLACGEMSPVAWTILKQGANFWLSIPDDSIAPVMRLLAEGRGDGNPVVGGESGVAGLAGFLAAALNEESRKTLKIDDHSRILVIGTEGATDPTIYEELVGRSPEEVLKGIALATAS